MMVACAARLSATVQVFAATHLGQHISAVMILIFTILLSPSAKLVIDVIPTIILMLVTASSVALLDLFACVK